MIILKDILKPHDIRTDTLRGASIVLRAVLGFESAELERQMPEPFAPTTRDYQTEQHQEDLKRYNVRRRAGLVGISAEIANEKGERWTPARDRQWVIAWADSIWHQLTEYEVVRLCNSVQAIGVVLPKGQESQEDRVGTDAKPGN